MQKPIGIIGLGLIGGSIALALKDKRKVYAYDVNTDSLNYALKNNVITKAVKDFSEFANCEITFVCTPLNTVVDVVKAVSSATLDKTIISDVGSVKSNLLGIKARVVGGHPMAGTENSGIKSAKAHLFENAYYCIVEYEQTSVLDVQAVEDFVKTYLKAIPKRMSVAEHDEQASRISHLPHAVSYALSYSALSENIPDIIGSGFTDTTRIALSNADFWTSVFLLNGDNVVEKIDDFTTRLNELKGYIKQRDGKKINEFISSAKELRSQTTYKKAYLTNYVLDVDVVDEIGSIWRVAEKLMKNNVNIKNVSILNSRIGSGGALRIEVYDEQAYIKAKQILGVK